MTCRVRSLLYRFGDDHSGTIAILTGLLVVPLILAVGLFLDYSRSLVAREKLANAIDAAALAVGASAGKHLSDAEIKQLAQSYFDANYPPAERGWVAPLDVQVDGDVVTIAASGKVDTTLMRLAKINEVDIGARTEVTRKQNKVELVMALDTTGSMAGSKLSALKTASKGLVEDLLKDEDDADYVKIGLVPFSAAVNVGADKKASGWIDENAQSSIHAEDFRAGINLFDLYDDIRNKDWGGCVRARPAPYDVSDDEPNPSMPDTLFVPYFAPDEPDGSDPTYPNNYLGDKAAKKDSADKRQRSTAKYDDATVSLTNISAGRGPDFNCPAQAILPLTNVKDDIIDELDDMAAKGSTVVPEGLAWGWRVASPGEPYTEGVAYDDDDTIKAIVLLTDGNNDIGGGMNNHNGSFYNAFGYPTSDHLGDDDGDDAEDVLDDKTAALCVNVKAQGIRLYTITFQVSSTRIRNLLRTCATEPSMYYNTQTGADLKDVFADIAKGLNKLRISK